MVKDVVDQVAMEVEVGCYPRGRRRQGHHEVDEIVLFSNEILKEIITGNSERLS